MINHAPTKYHNLPESSYFALGKEQFRFKNMKFQEKNRNLKLSKRKTFRAIQLKKFSKKKIRKYFLENKFQETLSK